MDAQHFGAGWSCGNCGTWHDGPVPPETEFYNFEDFYTDETLPVNTPLDQIKKWLDEHVETITCIPCSDCMGPDPSDVYSYEDAWQCGHCEEFYESQEEAENCCEYRREWRDRQIREAEKLLQRSGYTVVKQETDRPAVLDQIKVNAQGGQLPGTGNIF